MRRLITRGPLRKGALRNSLVEQNRLQQVAPVSAHILPTSATLVGGCLTALSLVKFAHIGLVGIFLDRLLGFGTCLLLGSALTSFISMRIGSHAERFEYVAEVLFLLALILLAFAAFALAFEIS